MDATEYVTPKELAKLLKVTRPTIYNWMRKKELPFIKIGSTIRISKKEVEFRGMGAFLNDSSTKQ